MKKTHIALMACALTSVPVIAAEYIIRVDTGVELTGDWNEVSSTETEWVASGGLTNCVPGSDYPEDKVDGDTYSHSFSCDQEETRVITTLFENEFSGQTKTEESTDYQTVTKAEMRTITVQLADSVVGELYECDVWENAPSQNSDIELLDQVRGCLEPTIVSLNHGYDGLLMFEQTGLVQVADVIDTQSIARSNASCKTLLDEDSRLTSSTYQLSSGGAYCDMTTDGGGWTQVASANVSGVKAHTVTVNDKGLEYTEVLYSDNGSSNDWANGHAHPMWKWEGLDIGKQYFKIGGQWRNHGGICSAGACAAIGTTNSLPRSSYRILDSSSLCYNYLTNNTANCGDKVAIAIPSEMKVTAFADAETIHGNNSNNTLNYDFNLFVR